MTNPPSFPLLRPVPFLGIYTLNSVLEGFEGEIFRSGSHTVSAVTGPIQISVSVAIRDVGGGAGFSMGQQTLQFPPGRYLIIETERAFNEPLTPYASASLEVNEVAAMIAFLFPGLVAERKFEGFVNRQGSYAMGGSGPIRVIARPDDSPQAMASELAACETALEARSAGDRDRFRLAARWYAQGQFEENLVDRLLSWYISLEIHPTQGTADVPNAVLDYIHQRGYGHLSPADIKQKLELGHIASMRAAIVHDGKTHVAPAEFDDYERRLNKLDAVVRTCLRLLASLPIGSALDQYLA